MRHAGIDSFLILAILAVIVIHSRPFLGMPMAEGVIDQMARFAVPYFYVISGFLYVKRIQRTDNPGLAFRQFSGRISLVF